MKLDDKRGNQLTFLVLMVYFSSYLTRINFQTIISEFVTAENVKRSSASIVLTVMAITYGLGQIISGFLGDKISPRHLVFGGMVTAVIMNVLMPLCSPNIKLMTVIWGINGLSQAFMWPPLVKIMSAAMTEKKYIKTMPLFGFSTGGGTVAMYLLAPLIIHLLNWKCVFLFSAVFGAVASAVWFISTKKVLVNVEIIPQNVNKNLNSEKPKSKVHIPIILLITILLSIAIQGALRDGITTWVPSFISETFNLNNKASILSSVIMPVFHIIFNFVVYWFLRKMKNKVFETLVILFGCLSVSLAGLLVLGVKTLIIALPILAAVSGFVHGINSLQTCCIQNYFKDVGNIAFITGLLNCGTYIGSSFSTYLFAVISEKSGWNMTLVSWIAFSVAGVLLTSLCIRFYRSLYIKKLDKMKSGI